ncbi:MAG: PAS domain S-box protein, partial [Candidatus Lokiarchaeota archaeon]|nr:PAS domain S-box protein [Candidatus Lokiarchaeota archaeon]MBD3340207.1 PAS domain S-box protein [Candidatus Lokiarchaeota archaeon]
MENNLLDEGFFDLIYNSIDDVILIIDENYQIKKINERIVGKILRFPPDYLIGTSLKNFIHKEDKDNLIDLGKSILKGKSKSFEIRLKNIEEEYLWFDIKGAKYTHKNKNYIVLHARETSHYRKREEKLIAEKESLLETLNKIKDSDPELRFWKILYPQKHLSAI